jgi:hypothetical protein
VGISRTAGALGISVRAENPTVVEELRGGSIAPGQHPS